MSPIDMNPLVDGAAADGGTVDPGGGVFDPDRVYVFGSTYSGGVYVPVIDDFNDSTAPIPGFDAVDRFRGEVRASDGRIIYNDPVTHSTGVNVFVPDRWSRGTGGQNVYPAAPDANDVPVSTPQCSAVRNVHVEPGTGDILYDCETCATPDTGCLGTVFRSSGGEYISLGANSRWWPGHNGATLHTSGGLTLRTGVATVAISTDLSEFPTQTSKIVTVRATADGFRLVSREGSHYRLFVIDASGDVSLVDAYSSHPVHDLAGHHRLAANGDLYLIVRPLGSSETFGTIVLRIELGGAPPQVVVDDSSSVRPGYRGTLVTGP